MTAHHLIEDIFRRVQPGVPGHQRRLSRAQLAYLRDLIDRDEEGGALRGDGPGVTIWLPSGRWKYVLAEDLHGERHTLTRLGNLAPSDAGRLF